MIIITRFGYVNIRVRRTLIASVCVDARVAKQFTEPISGWLESARGTHTAQTICWSHFFLFWPWNSLQTGRSVLSDACGLFTAILIGLNCRRREWTRGWHFAQCQWNAIYNVRSFVCVEGPHHHLTRSVERERKESLINNDNVQERKYVCPVHRWAGAWSCSSEESS